MDYLSTLPLSGQLINLLAALVLLTSFMLLVQLRLVSVIHTFAWQGALVAAVTVIVAWSGHHGHLYLSALITFVIKALFIPWLLHYHVNHLGLRRYVSTHPPLIGLMIASMLVVFCYYIILPIELIGDVGESRNIIAITLSVVLIGLLGMIIRHHAIGQVVSFMSIENGLFFAAVATTKGMPLVVELGIAFDVLVAAVLFGVFFFDIHGRVGSMDVDDMTRLSETRD